jgi:hypothetical protein
MRDTSAFILGDKSRLLTKDRKKKKENVVLVMGYIPSVSKTSRSNDDNSNCLNWIFKIGLKQ